jgi:hypothetical protein
VIRMISDLVSSNLIIMDATVESNH